MLTDAADYSALWLLLAAALGLGGGPKGRRAAAQGLLALGFASATVNGPLKLLVGRRRPAHHRPLRRNPRTSSFPSGHAASAFAFATAATRELRQAGPLLVPLAVAVAYSRVYLGVHYPSDVLAGAAIGVGAGLAVRPAERLLGMNADEPSRRESEVPLLSEAVLVASPGAARTGRLARARKAIHRQGIVIVEQLDVEDVERLPQLLQTATDEPRLVITAGGDGTVGSVASRLGGQDNPMAILPLGTANDFARSLSIPMSPRRAASLLTTGRIDKVDLGRVTRLGEPVEYFAHAATAGLNVTFASIATQASIRARLGRLTYVAAAALAACRRTSFTCVLNHSATVEELTLLELSVINAPVFGGPLGLTVPGLAPDDGEVVVLAIGDIPLHRLLWAGLFLLFGVERPVKGVQARRVSKVSVGGQCLGLTLDGEVKGALPAEFDVVPGSLRVVTPRPNGRDPS